MSSVERVLKRAGIRNTQSQFMKLLFGMWLAIPGLSRLKILRMSLRTQ
jgi:hypothetical protein